MFNSRKFLPALAIFAMLGAGNTSGAQAAASDIGYLDFAGSSSFNNSSILDSGNLYQGQINSFTSGYRAPNSGSHARTSIVDRTSTGVIHQYYDVNDPYYNYRDPDPIRVEIKYNDVYQNAYNVAQNSSQDYIAPRDMKDVYNDQFFVGYTYDSDGHRDRAVYQYTDGSNTYNDYFNAAHYEQFAQGTIKHNEILTQQTMGNAITPTPNNYDYNTMDWAGMASGAYGGATGGGASGSGGIGGYVSDYAGSYAGNLFDNIDLSYGSGSSGSSGSGSSGGITQYLSFGSSGNANGVETSSMSFGTPLAKPVADLAMTGRASPSFAPTLNALGSVAGMTKMSDFYKNFGSADFLNNLPGGMGGKISGMLDDAADTIGQKAGEAGSQFFSSMSDSFSDFSMSDIGLGDFSLDSFGMGDFDMGSMFEGFDIGSLDFVGDFDLGSLTDGLNMGDMFGGMMDGFDIGSIIDTDAITGSITSAISEGLSDALGNMLGSFLGDFDIGGAIGSFFG